MAIDIKKLTNVNVYLNGTSTLGRVEEFDVPDVVFKMAEHKALGLFGSFEIPTGIDKLEARCKWNAYYPDVMAQSGNPMAPNQFILRGDMPSYGPTGKTGSVGFKCIVTGYAKNLPGFKFKQGDNVEVESKFSVTYLKVVVDGQDSYEVDVMANILKINGQNILADMNANQ